ncbi:hypothetical protein [Mesorhizobium sp.]|uniref:hypothetical protein n=1 Tax=Mesorhizobium sp. TaxID=1871066 RepID=UPI0025D9C34E|nr:hypothetical protein [Mesorhizobium sp.]
MAVALPLHLPSVAILVDVIAFGHRPHPAQMAGMNLGWTLWKSKTRPRAPGAIK